MDEKKLEQLKSYKTPEELKKAIKSKEFELSDDELKEVSGGGIWDIFKNATSNNELSDEDLENVNGGRHDDTYGESISSGDVGKITSGTAVIYTDTYDSYKHHHALFVRESEHGIVLKPADEECKSFFNRLCKDENSYMNDTVDGDTAYDIFYAWNTINYLYLE